MKMKKVVIIGMGLVGGSIGKALIKRGLADEVIGVCRRESSLERAVKEKSLTEGFVNNYAEATKGADLVIIATPVHTVKDVLDGLSEVITDGRTLVTDAGSTKKEIAQHALKYKDSFIFIGAHPLAGSEKAGVEHADADLFENSICILTPQDGAREEDINSLKKFWNSLGAEVDVITPEEHDSILAFTSHLPHIAAYALAGLMESKYKKYASTGFKDTTRIASSDPVLWSDIFMSNRDNTLLAIKQFKEVVSRIENKIRENLKDDLKGELKSCKEKRDELV